MKQHLQKLNCTVVLVRIAGYLCLVIGFSTLGAATLFSIGPFVWEFFAKCFGFMSDNAIDMIFGDLIDDCESLFLFGAPIAFIGLAILFLVKPKNIHSELAFFPLRIGAIVLAIFSFVAGFGLYGGKLNSQGMWFCKNIPSEISPRGICGLVFDQSKSDHLTSLKSHKIEEPPITYSQDDNQSSPPVILSQESPVLSVGDCRSDKSFVTCKLLNSGVTDLELDKFRAICFSGNNYQLSTARLTGRIPPQSIVATSIVRAPELTARIMLEKLN